jgi:hypothetical protein
MSLQTFFVAEGRVEATHSREFGFAFEAVGIRVNNLSNIFC